MTLWLTIPWIALEFTMVEAFTGLMLAIDLVRLDSSTLELSTVDPLTFEESIVALLINDKSMIDKFTTDRLRLLCAAEEFSTRERLEVDPVILENDKLVLYIPLMFVIDWKIVEFRDSVCPITLLFIWIFWRVLLNMLEFDTWEFSTLEFVTVVLAIVVLVTVEKLRVALLMVEFVIMTSCPTVPLTVELVTVELIMSGIAL